MVIFINQSAFLHLLIGILSVTFCFLLPLSLTYVDLPTSFLPVRSSLVAQSVKNLPAMQKIQVQSLGWEDSLEKGTATHSSILAWRSPWTEEPGGLQSMGSQRAGHC